MRKSRNKEPYTLVMVEGDTEEVFYQRVKVLYFERKPLRIINLGGNWNINKKILDEAVNFLENHPDRRFRICVAIDRESRYELAPIDMGYIKHELSVYSNISQKNIRLFEAVQDIESWFFHDVAGIFEFLRIPHSQRNPSKYSPVDKFNNHDLSRLFKVAGKQYNKGVASTNFINNLNIPLIRSLSPTFNSLCIFLEN